MARRRENARLARAAETAHERESDALVGQVLVLGFGGAPRLLNFSARGRAMFATDAESGVEVRIPARLPWAVAKMATAPKTPATGFLSSGGINSRTTPTESIRRASPTLPGPAGDCHHA